MISAVTSVRIPHWATGRYRPLYPRRRAITPSIQHPGGTASKRLPYADVEKCRYLLYIWRKRASFPSDGLSRQSRPPITMGEVIALILREFGPLSLSISSREAVPSTRVDILGKRGCFPGDVSRRSSTIDQWTVRPCYRRDISTRESLTSRMRYDRPLVRRLQPKDATTNPCATSADYPSRRKVPWHLRMRAGWKQG